MARKEYLPEKPADEVEQLSPIYRAFKDQFGEKDANQVLLAGAHMRERTHLDDWFVDCLVVAIAYECFSTFRDQHGFSEQSETYVSWIKDNVDLTPYWDDSDGATVVTSNKKKFVGLGLGQGSV